MMSKWPKYNGGTGEFLGLYETVRFMVLRGSPEVFFNYGYDKDKSKVLYYHYRRRIPNSFYDTIFNHHRAMIKSGEIDSEFSNICFFLPSITNRSKDINKYLENVSISPIDITQKQFDDWGSCPLCLMQCLRHTNHISNSNLVRNADAFLYQKEVEVPDDLIGDQRNV